ncbi:LexA family protein [Shewanella xiamenensis]|uniref:LexA family protein n=1 Tax=Shewanella xiamenensis TaxID=332186 RepID=UPI001558FF31|nr:S24 family peptidase [Shewanella xiamenensis]
MRIIPIYASAGLTGFESPAEEYRQLGLSLDQLLIIHPNATFMGFARGDSMQGAGIYFGDLLIVDRHETARDGDVIVANFNGEFVCKILDKTSRLLLSANEQFQPQPIHDYDTFSIEGVVVSSIRFHRQNSTLANLKCLL